MFECKTSPDRWWSCSFHLTSFAPSAGTCPCIVGMCMWGRRCSNPSLYYMNTRTHTHMQSYMHTLVQQTCHFSSSVMIATDAYRRKTSYDLQVPFFESWICTFSTSDMHMLLQDTPGIRMHAGQAKKFLEVQSKKWKTHNTTWPPQEVRCAWE